MAYVPFHFRGDNGQVYKGYVQEKISKSMCGMNCFHKAEEKNLKERKSIENSAKFVIVI